MKVWVWTNLSRNFTANIATINEPAKPTKIIEYSFWEKAKPLFKRSSPVAAAIVGTASRKENSTAVFLLAPTKRPPIIVAADLETPDRYPINYDKIL